MFLNKSNKVSYENKAKRNLIKISIGQEAKKEIWVNLIQDLR